MDNKNVMMTRNSLLPPLKCDKKTAYNLNSKKIKNIPLNINGYIDLRKSTSLLPNDKQE